MFDSGPNGDPLLRRTTDTSTEENRPAGTTALGDESNGTWWPRMQGRRDDGPVSDTVILSQLASKRRCVFRKPSVTRFWLAI
jgi:hypothetical protein